MVNIPEILANLVFATVFLWFVAMLIFPKSIFDLVEEQKLPKTVLEHFMYIASIGYFEDGHGKFWKQLAMPDKRSQAASQHQTYMAGQRMIATMYSVYAGVSMIAMAYVIFTVYASGATWYWLFFVFLISLPVWTWHVSFARQVATWNSDLDSQIRVHTPMEMKLFKSRAVILATVSLIFIFS